MFFFDMCNAVAAIKSINFRRNHFNYLIYILLVSFADIFNFFKVLSVLVCAWHKNLNFGCKIITMHIKYYNHSFMS